MNFNFEANQNGVLQSKTDGHSKLPRLGFSIQDRKKLGTWRHGILRGLAPRPRSKRTLAPVRFPATCSNLAQACIQTQSSSYVQLRLRGQEGSQMHQKQQCHAYKSWDWNDRECSSKSQMNKELNLPAKNAHFRGSLQHNVGTTFVRGF